MYDFDICLSCGVDLNDENWPPYLKKQHCLRCRYCFNNNVPKNKEISDRLIELSKPAKFNCITCEKLLILNDNWRDTNKKHGIYLCNECKTIKEKIRNLDIREMLQNGYNNKCNCCGESSWQFLTVDHIFNDGVHDRKMHFCGEKFFNYLIELNFPTDRYQLLCMNCNYSKAKYNFCPHLLENKTKNSMCNFCNCMLNDENMFPVDMKNSYEICKTCSVALAKYDNNVITDKNLRDKQGRLKLKQDVFDNYGGICECCGEDEFYFLNIDHILGGGSSRKNRTKLSSGNGLYRWLRQNNYPKDNYRILCYNCNCSRGFYGQCYHELNREHNKIITIADYKELVRNNLV